MLLKLSWFFPLCPPPPSTPYSLRQSPHHCSLYSSLRVSVSAENRLTSFAFIWLWVYPGAKFLTLTFAPSLIPFQLLASWNYSSSSHLHPQLLISPKHCSKEKSNTMSFTLGLRYLPNFHVAHLRTELSFSSATGESFYHVFPNCMCLK